MASIFNYIEDDLDLTNEFNMLAESFDSVSSSLFDNDDCTSIAEVAVNNSASAPLAAAPPRMVSLPSMTSVREHIVTEKTSETPYEALKGLVRDRSSNKRVLGASPMYLCKPKNSLLNVDMKRSACVFMKTQTLFQETLKPSAKKQKLHHAGGEQKLHKACQQSAKFGEIHDIVKCDPRAAGRQAKLTATKSVYDAQKMKMVSKVLAESYTYPLSLAIQNKADTKTLETIINAAPQVLRCTDGPNQETPLHVLLRYKPSDIDTLETMLLNANGIASRKDRRFNTPLHTACMYGASIDVVRHLCILYPEAVSERNFNGMTPMQLTQRLGAVCSNEIADFLWEKQQQLFL